MKRKPNIAVVGATGVVGSTFLKVLEERDFPFENIYMMASKKSAGKKEAEILEGHIQMAKDPMMDGEVSSLIKQGKCAEEAVDLTYTKYMEMFFGKYPLPHQTLGRLIFSPFYFPLRPFFPF